MSRKEIIEKNDGRIFDLAVEFGIGVLAWDDLRKEFQEIQTSKKFVPNPDYCSEFIENFKSDPIIHSKIANSKDEYDAYIAKLIKDRL